MCLLFWTHSVHCQKGQGPSVLPTMKYMAPEGMIGVRPGTVDSSLKQISALACMRKEEEEEEEEVHYWGGGGGGEERKAGTSSKSGGQVEEEEEGKL